MFVAVVITNISAHSKQNEVVMLGLMKYQVGLITTS